MLYYVLYTIMPGFGEGYYKLIETERKLPFEITRAKCIDFSYEVAKQYIYDLFGHEDDLSIDEEEEFDRFVNDCYFDYKIFEDKATAEEFIENDGFYE